MNKTGLKTIIALPLVLLIFVTGCLKDNSEELQAKHDEGMAHLKQKYNIAETDTIGDGIYLKIIEEGEGQIYPIPGDMIIADLFGQNKDDNVFDVYNEEDARENNVYRDDHVYGPLRLYINQTPLGFYKAIQRVSEGATAVILMPHQQAFLNYEPLLYKVTVHKVVKDVEAYNQASMNEYLAQSNFDSLKTFEGVDSVFFNLLEESTDTTENTISLDDTVTITINAHFVETDTTVTEGYPGRQFFPLIEDKGDTVKFVFGDYYFPVTPIVSFAVQSMDVGSTWEIIAHDSYCYGTNGFLHPFTGVVIVPPSMPVYYKIKLLKFKKAYEASE